MSGFLLASYAILWIVTLILVTMVLLLYRQFGLIWMRGRDRLALQGLDIGSKAPNAEVMIQGTVSEVEWRGSSSIVLLTLPTCPICRQLAAEIVEYETVARGLKRYWIDAEAPALSNELEEVGWIVGLSLDEAAHSAFEVSALPFAYVLDQSGAVAEKGLVNHVIDIETLVEKAPVEHHEQKQIAAAGRQLP